jgi:hypothetical protein
MSLCREVVPPNALLTKVQCWLALMGRALACKSRGSSLKNGSGPSKEPPQLIMQHSS